MKDCTLYLKIDRNSLVTQEKVLLSDVAKITCERQDVLRKVKNIVIYNFAATQKDSKRHTAICMSILKVIQLIHEICPGCLVVNEGESDFVIEYQKQQEKNSWLDKIKTIFLCIVIFFGSAFSIMAFNNDVSLVELFAQFYEQVMGRPQQGPGILEVGYSIGLAVGITVFFNHVGSKKITRDPTPLQVEMRKYENDLDMTFIENAGRKEHNIDVD
ncbi:MAG: stage V sporulation protein AA [Roseburia sp.]|nr:stage V sporulation protein AA [Roseburia sp.]